MKKKGNISIKNIIERNIKCQYCINNNANNNDINNNVSNNFI